MNNDKILVEERSRDIGNFLVGRLLPFRKKRQVGPFTFIDHMGPVVFPPDQNMDVDQHPHIGLSTLTYLFEGQVEHKDSTGAHQIIGPGDVGFMTSGKGCTHTERTSPLPRPDGELRMHGYQVWVALPKELEEMEPNFQFIPAQDLPSCEQDGLSLTLIAGEGFGMKAPLQVYSPLFMVKVFSEKDNHLELSGQIEGEIAIVVVNGKVSDEDIEIGAGQMLISKTKDECCLDIEAGTTLLLFGGEPFPEERFLYWNFVSSRKERLQKAKEDWQNKRFPKVPGDNTYIPLKF